MIVTYVVKIGWLIDLSRMESDVTFIRDKLKLCERIGLQVYRVHHFSIPRNFKSYRK